MKALILAMALLLSACAGTNFDWAEAEKVKAGMTERQVVDLLGTPNVVKNTPEGVILVWSHVNPFSGVKTLAIPFADGKVSVAPHLPTAYK
jgi:ABC-type Fe3+-hydroxamate transport system substrate-binding protein